MNTIDLDNLDIKKIVLYLRGFLKEYNWEKFSRLYFMEKMETFYWKKLDKLTFWWDNTNKNEEQFYNLVLEYLLRKAKKDEFENIKFYKFLKDEIELPIELISIKTNGREINLSKLSKYFAWKLPNSEKINISDFIRILENNLDIKWNFHKYSSLFWAMKIDYDNLFAYIINLENWKNNIFKILKYFELSEDFIYPIKY